MNGENRPDSLTAENPQLNYIERIWTGMLRERFNSREFGWFFSRIKRQLAKWQKSLGGNLGETCLLALLTVFERTRSSIFPPIADLTFTKDLDGAVKLGRTIGIDPLILEQERLLEELVKFWQGLFPKTIPLPPFVADGSLEDFFGHPPQGEPRNLRTLIHGYLEQGGQPREVFTTMACGLQTCLTEQLDRAGSRGR